jgi:hypothetical protein
VQIPLKAIVKGRFGDQVDRIAPLAFADGCIQKPSSLVFLSIADQGQWSCGSSSARPDLHRSPPAGSDPRTAYSAAVPFRTTI